MRSRPIHSTGARSEVDRLKKELEELYIRADPRSVDDPELAADLGQYLCLRVSGYLEQAVAVILRDYCSKNSWGFAQQFAHSWIDRMPNLNADALTKMVRRFNGVWAERLDGFLAEEERRTSLNSLVGIRNGVAHGKQQGLSRKRAWEYFEVVEAIVEWLLVCFSEQATKVPVQRT
ncbi:HEPN domain-containing protein [Asanoa hainanensis]|uniref:HEPN domain-containing protein n=1 Tax=Asanoa hainanensis TaxID=560556 RepID=UPI001FE92439|nr:HEPN domain-containing protein [Asanoa hainanensis]